MKNKKRENSVKSLVNLYTVVIGVALTYSVTGLFDVNTGLGSISATSILLFISFIATLFPFFHGALRHLDDAYIENNNTHIKDGALIIDFVLLFIHALSFVILSLLIKLPGHFAWVLVLTLTIDVLWGIFATFGSSSKGVLTAETKWTIINFVFVGVSIWYLIYNKIFLAELASPINLAIPIAFFCVLRSLVDYIWCKDFYFPN
jgi:hypothetical protein